jgi:UDP-glucose 4-epimerase
MKNNSNNISVLVLGGTGFIGSNLIQGLLAKGYQVTSLSRTKVSINDAGNYLFGDITDSKLMRKLVGQNYDLIYHCAGFSGVGTEKNPQDSKKINVESLKKLFDLILKLSPETRVVMCGSRLEYGKVDKIPVSENQSTKPIGVYGKHKLRASKLAMDFSTNRGLKVTILRISNIYGPHREFSFNHYNVINHFIDMAREGKNLTIFGDGEQLRDYLYIGDLIELMILVGENEKSIGKIYNVGFGEGRPFRDLPEAIAKKFGVKVVYKPWPTSYKQVETGDYVTDISKVEKELRWRPKKSFEDWIDSL